MCKQIKSQNLYLISEDYKATGDCRLYLGDDFGESHVALSKKSDELVHWRKVYDSMNTL